MLPFTSVDGGKPFLCLSSQQEDERLRELVAEYGQKKWSLIASKLGTKGSKQVGCCFDVRMDVLQACDTSQFM